MDADLTSLELKINKLINFCAILRDENSGLRNDLVQSHQKVQALQANMLQASNQLENLLELMPKTETFESVRLQNAKSI